MRVYSILLFLDAASIVFIYDYQLVCMKSNRINFNLIFYLYSENCDSTLRKVMT